jgi:hypothetical protein
LRTLNGRVIGDLFGKYTCHKPTGSSDFAAADESQ